MGTKQQVKQSERFSSEKQSESNQTNQKKHETAGQAIRKPIRPIRTQAIRKDRTPLGVRDLMPNTTEKRLRYGPQ